MEEFDVWNKIKKNIDADNYTQTNFPQSQEVWLCMLGKNVGSEQNGGRSNFSRPVIVIKKFSNKIYWVVPLSSKQKDLDYYHNFIDPEGSCVSAIVAQMRLISVKRFKRKMYEMDELNFLRIKNMLIRIMI